MAKTAKPTRAEKKAQRAAKKQSRRETLRNIREAFRITRANDRRLIPYLVLFGLIGAAAAYLIVFAVMGSVIVPIPFAVLTGLLVAMFVFSSRAPRAMVNQAPRPPSAA